MASSARATLLSQPALAELRAAWQSPWSAELLGGVGATVAFRSLWAITESARALPAEAELGALAKTARRRSAGATDNALERLRQWPEDGRAFSMAAFAALARRDEPGFVAKVVPLLASRKVWGSPLAGPRTVVGALIAPRGRIDEAALKGLVSEGAPAVVGDDMAVLTALACRRAGGGVWRAFWSQREAVLGRRGVSVSVVDLVKGLSGRSRLTILTTGR